jgi:hypothetical protein
LIESAVRAVLLADPAVTALVGAGAEARIYPLILPQGAAFPALTYQRVSSVTQYAQDGPGLARQRIQIDAWAMTYRAAKDLARAVRSALEGHRAGNIQGVFVDPERDFYEADTRLYRASTDFYVWCLADVA